MGDRQIIQVLGGAASLVRRFRDVLDKDVGRSMISHWITKDTIPPQWRLDVKSIAEHAGIELPNDFLFRERGSTAETADEVQ